MKRDWRINCVREGIVEDASVSDFGPWGRGSSPRGQLLVGAAVRRRDPQIRGIRVTDSVERVRQSLGRGRKSDHAQ